MYKKFFTSATAMVLFAGSAMAAGNSVTGVVNFTTCITDSKHGKKELENLESLRKQMDSLVENTKKELTEIASKFEDTEYLDSLSPKGEEELKMKYQSLQEDLARYENQFYQVRNHANYQMVQKMSGAVSTAAKQVAEDNKLDYVINKEACFYIRPDLDVTTQIISLMDKEFEIEAKTKKVSDNEEMDLKALDEMTLNRAG